MGGWYFAAWKGKKEYYLPKMREVVSNLVKRKRGAMHQPHRKPPFLFIRNRQNSDVSVEYW